MSIKLRRIGALTTVLVMIFGLTLVPRIYGLADAQNRVRVNDSNKFTQIPSQQVITILVQC